MSEHTKAWQCIGCGRIEAPQTCIGICEDCKVELRPFGGWLADKLGGAIVTLRNFGVMAMAVIGVIYFLRRRFQRAASPAS